MEEEQKEKLWEEHCIQGDEHNPTDTMYYEGFMDVIDIAYQAGKEEVLRKAKKLHYEYLKGIKVRETLPAKLAEIYTLGIDDYYHFLSSKE